MLVQIYIGTGVREFIDDQSELFGRKDKSHGSQMPHLNFIFIVHFQL